GNFPRRIPVTSTVQDLDLGTSREGRTDVITPDALPFAAAFHLLGNIDSVIDRIGPGSSTIGFTVSGSGADSGPFTYERGNVYASPFDIGFDSIFELLFNVDALSNFPGEEVTIDSVDIDLTLQEALSTYRIDEVRAGVDGNAPEPVGELLVQPGSVIDLEIDLTGTPDQVPLTVGLSVPVPEDAFGFGFLGISGGGGGFFFDECLFNPQACGDGNVQDLVDTLEAQPRNDELTATLQVEQIGQPGEPGQPGATEEAIAQEEGPAYAQAGDPVTSTAQLDRFVDGFVGIGVNIDSPFCPGCPPVFGRVAGEDRVGTAISTAFYAFGFAETVVLAPADDYPYALVAGPLAARDRAPILLSREGELSPGVGAAISGLGATRAVIVAPDGQLTGTVEDDLRAAGITTIERLGGADRYAVADSVAAAMGGTRAWVVEGENADPNRGWPDAVSAGPVAGLEGAPILLTRAGDLPQTTADTLARLGITDVSIAGGEAAVSQAVADDIASRGISVERIAGDNRYDTSYLLAQRAIDLGGVPFNTWMVTGLDFPDALSTAPAVVATGGVMIMGDGQDVYASPAAVQYFTDLQYTAPFVTFVGGFAAISQTVEEQVFGILIGQPAGGEGEPGSPTPQPTSQPPPPPPPGVPPPPPPQP
ncbi:MAG: cell wall-binding repeat-containing protein, partial [Euzebya sp.]